MIIKKFLGKTEEEAVEAAKKELGDNVVIMNVKQIKPKGLFAAFRAKMVEVTVALEDEPVSRAPAVKAGTISGQTTFQPLAGQNNSTMQNNSALQNNPAGQNNNIERKLDSLQTLLESQIKKSESRTEYYEGEKWEGAESKNAEKALQPEKAEEQPTETEQDKFVRLLYNTMIDNDVDEKYANQILEDVDRSRKPNMPFDYILANIYQKMILKFNKSEGILPAEKGPRIVLFIGPTGVGKTTTIVKLASHYAMEEKKKTALLTTDTYRIAAAEQLRTYAGIMEVPFRVVYTEEELCAAVADFKDCDYIFIDTAGHSHQNEEQMEKMKSMLDAVKKLADIQTFLVLSATTKYRDLRKIADNYKEISSYQLIFTKLDETATLGGLLNLKLYADTPIAYVTYGQNVPDDIEKFNPQKIVKQILGGRA